MRIGKVESGIVAVCLAILGPSVGCAKKNNSTAQQQGPTTPPQSKPKGNPVPQPTNGQPAAPVGGTPKYNAPGGTSINGGPVTLDGSINDIADDLGYDNDDSGFSLTATYALTLSAPSGISLTSIQPDIEDDAGNSCTYQSFAILMSSTGATIATVPVASTVTTTQTIALGGTQPAGTYQLAIVLQSPSACTVDFLFGAVNTPAVQPAVSTGSTTPAVSTGSTTPSTTTPPVAPAS